MTVDEIVDEICGPINYNPNNATHSARALRWANAEALDLAWHFDIPGSITRNDTFELDGSESYDLTDEAYFDSSFLRVLDESVRIGTIPIRTLAKEIFDQIDPSRSYGSQVLFCCQLGRHNFSVFPPTGSGDTVYCDWMAAPAAITSATEEADLPFGEQFQEVLVTGGIWRGMRYKGLPEYERFKAMHEKDRQRIYNESFGMKRYAQELIQGNF